MARRWRYEPPTELPLAIRAVPHVFGEITEHRLRPGEAFCAAQELYRGREGVLYLKLEDGRGWAFDRKPGVGVMCVRRPADPACPAPNDCRADTAGAVGASAARAPPFAAAAWPDSDSDEPLDAVLYRWIWDGLAMQQDAEGWAIVPFAGPGVTGTQSPGSGETEAAKDPSGGVVERAIVPIAARRIRVGQEQFGYSGKKMIPSKC